jgi:hypothetical protein
MKYHEVAKEMTPKQKSMYFQLGAEVANRKAVQYGFRTDSMENYAHELALVYLAATEWKSLKAARAMMTVRRVW